MVIAASETTRMLKDSQVVKRALLENINQTRELTNAILATLDTTAQVLNLPFLAERATPDITNRITERPLV